MVNSAVLSVMVHSGNSEWRWFIKKNNMGFTTRSHVHKRPRSLSCPSPFKLFPFPFGNVASSQWQIWLVWPGRSCFTWAYCCYSPWQILFPTICLLPCSSANTAADHLCVFVVVFQMPFSFFIHPAPFVWFIMCDLLTVFFSFFLIWGIVVLWVFYYLHC